MGVVLSPQRAAELRAPGYVDPIQTERDRANAREYLTANALRHAWNVAEDHRQEARRRAIFWLRESTRTSVDQSYRNLALRLSRAEEREADRYLAIQAEIDRERRDDR